MSLMPYNPYFDGAAAPLLPFPPVGSYGYGWSPFWHHPLHYQPFAMLRAAEAQLWQQHHDHLASTNQQAIGPNGDFNFHCNAIGYKPEELGVDIRGNEVVISGQHRQQHGRDHPNAYHQFYRRFTLPEGVRPESLKCDLAENGTLSITGQASPPAIEYGSGSSGRRTPIPIRNTSAGSERSWSPRHQRAITY